jgi:hypothetical protein
MSFGRQLGSFSVMVRHAAIGVLGAAMMVPGNAAAEDGRAFFESKIRPVLVEHCYQCHSAKAEKVKGGLRLDSRDAARAGGDNGPAVVPGRPEESLLLQALTHTDDFLRMPPKGKLPDPVLADFRRWIELGAPDPRDGSAASLAEDDLAQRDWWSLRPISLPTIPATDVPSWALTPIDAFILAKQLGAGLSPAPDADRRTLIRRITFDLTGLPPTPDEIDTFLGDTSPDAYERLVDRLLDSPHYGERWARHWMDAVHFAETHGHDQDRIREHAWPYRDYLIESFNRDTPYARFIQEQVAADVLFPDEPARAVALGMLAAGPWDESSLRDIREDSIDREIGRYLDRDDMISTVMSTFVSSTVHCARCHDHKFDPISQEDYYSLQAVFAGTDRGNRPYDTDPAVHRRREAIAMQRRALRERDPAALAALLDPEFQSEVTAWETALIASQPGWVVLEPEGAQSASGANLRIQTDGSIRSEGARPPTDTYTITTRTDLRGITAIRLELLPDEQLPNRGPGRNDNGNLHLTEFRLEASPALDPEAPPRRVPVTTARADFDQEGWGISGAVDGDGQTAWGIYPEVGRPHEGVFELAEDLGHFGGTVLTIHLDQTHPAGHLIGRLRLSVSTAPRPVRPHVIPPAIVRLMDIPHDLRTDDQRRELAELYRVETLNRQAALLPPPRLVYAGASDFVPDNSHKPAKGPRAVHVLQRGDIHQKLAEAQPGTLACLDGLPSRFVFDDPSAEGPRRAALARWLTDPNNPLLWRSIVNRVWHHHFGRGIVETPNDFGRMGALPTHPELLEWLAATFRDSGGSLKALHRLIVTSRVYRQSSGMDPAASEIDADNRLLARMNRTRLDAEQVRDAVLSVCGRLDRTMGGPSVRQFGLRPGVHVTPVVDYSEYDWNSPGSGRRAVYRFLFRTLPDPFLDSFDAADASQLTAARNVSVTPLQALALLNDPFMVWASEQFARRLESQATDRVAQLRAAYLLAFGRHASEPEIELWAAYAGRHGLPNACRMLLNSNEFLFID